LLKDEFSAIETYQQALDKLRGNAVRVSEYLIPIYENHKDAFSSLQTKSVSREKLLRELWYLVKLGENNPRRH
jgi:hypothetical protein